MSTSGSVQMNSELAHDLNRFQRLVFCLISASPGWDWICLYLALSRLVLSCLVLSCRVVSCLVVSCRVLSIFCLLLSCLVLSCVALSCLFLSCAVLCCLLLSCPFFLSCLLFSCLFLPWLDLTGPALPCRAFFWARLVVCLVCVLWVSCECFSQRAHILPPKRPSSSTTLFPGSKCLQNGIKLVCCPFSSLSWRVVPYLFKFLFRPLLVLPWPLMFSCRLLCWCITRQDETRQDKTRQD